MFLKYKCQKNLKENCARPASVEELQAAINFSKVSLQFDKYQAAKGISKPS